MGRKACLSTILLENELEVILKLMITIKLVNFRALCRADFVDGLPLQILWHTTWIEPMVILVATEIASLLT